MLSQTIIQTFCPKLFLTFCIKSAHFIQVGTSTILSKGKAKIKEFFKSSSEISHCIC